MREETAATRMLLGALKTRRELPGNGEGTSGPAHRRQSGAGQTHHAEDREVIGVIVAL